MCGIAGFIGSGTTEDIRRMTMQLAHRGPDDCGYWSDPARAIHLGHRRLSILDLAGGHQPMLDAEQDLVIVFNGEIYNFATLRSELINKGHRFLTDHSDTEVILRAYREWGPSLTTRLNGMWAFAIFDRRNCRLFASRDRFGKKPFYYTKQGDTFAFASELSSLRMHPSAPREHSRRALQKYFAYGYIPAPHTILEGVHKLPGGHSLTFDLSSRDLRIDRYWEYVIEPFSAVPRNPVAEWGEQVRTLLDAAVKRRLVADVPVGVFLSGGIDSSAVTALAARHLPAGRLKTFSIGFEEPSFDESVHARRVAHLFGTEHHTEVLSMEKARTLLPDIVAQLDEPMGDSSLLPTYLLSRFTRQHVTVALGGDAGDELFAGYDPFRAVRKAAFYSKVVPRPVHAAILALASRLPVSHANMSLDFKLKRALRGLSYPPQLWLPVWMASVSPQEIAQLFGEPVELEDLYSEAIACWERCSQPDPVDRLQQFFTQLYLQDDILVKVDRASMMHGLEARAPFLDIDFVNFARRIPAQWKYRGGQTKFILKKALEPLLPQEILYRGKKGFGVPIGSWFHAGVLAPDPQPVPGLDSAFAARALASHQAGHTDHRAFLWNYWLYQHWSRTAGTAA